MPSTTAQTGDQCPKLPWMIDFHSTADGKVLNDQLKAAFADNFLEHLSRLHVDSKPKRKRQTQFSVIIPPGVSIEHIEEFLKAGMTVALLRMDYFTAEAMEATTSLLKQVNEEFGKKIGRVYPLGIALDISEKDIVTGKLQRPLKQVELEKGQKTRVSANPQFANRTTKDYIYVNYDQISNVVKPGDSLILGNNEICMSAQEVVRDIITCIIEKAGLLTDNLSVKIPNVPTIPETESNDRIFKIKEKCEIDMVFVGPAKIDIAKEIFGPTVLVFAKVEYASSVELLEQLVNKADGVLLDGDKLMVTTQERVFLMQKSTIARCNKLAKPVIAAVNCHSITKAQVSDIANTIIDGVDGLLLPPDPDLLESISLICKAAEGAIYQRQLFDNLARLKQPPIEPIVSVAMAAVEASFNSNAAAIILLTTSGRSAKLISMFRPRCPIIALTRFGRIAKQLMVYKGVIPIFYIRKTEDSYKENVEKNMQLGMTFAKLSGYIKMGDAVVIVFGSESIVGFRNCMEVVFASEYDTASEGGSFNAERKTFNVERKTFNVDRKSVNVERKSVNVARKSQ